MILLKRVLPPNPHAVRKKQLENVPPVALSRLAHHNSKFHPFNKYFPSPFCMPGSVWGAWDMSASTTKISVRKARP